MKIASRGLLCVGLAALSLSPWAFAQISVSLSSAGGNVYDGIYVSPYYATVNGMTNTKVFCDDFGDDSNVGTTWNASVVSLSNVTPTNTSWGLAGGTATQYSAVAYLSLQILNQVAGSNGQITNTFADWAVFDPSGVASYLLNHPITSGALTTAALCTDIFGTAGCAGSWTLGSGGLLATAYNAPVPSGGYSLEVISPDLTGTNTLCKAESGCAAQEFIAITVPEGGSALGYLLVGAMSCFGAMVLHRRRRISVTSAV